MRQVVDASVVIAYLRNEVGGDILTNDDGPFYLSSVNLAEVLTTARDRALDTDEVMRVLKRLPFEHAEYSRDDAIRTATLRGATRAFGLSLGDRACLALAERLALPVITADREWAKLDIGIDIRLIR